VTHPASALPVIVWQTPVPPSVAEHVWQMEQSSSTVAWVQDWFKHSPGPLALLQLEPAAQA
jgi:hypothetical protein